MKKSKPVKSILFIVGVICVVAFLAIEKTAYFKDGASRKDDVINVKVSDLIQRVTIAGNVVPARKTLVTAPYNGYVKRLFVKIGQKVKKKDPIVSVTQSLQSSEQLFPLRSPLNGTVVAINKQEGEFVRQDDAKDYILRIDNLDEMFVVSNVAEVDMVKIEKGLEVIVKLSAVINKEYKGVVVSKELASKAQDMNRVNSKVEFLTKIKITNPDVDVKSGMSAILDIVTFKKEDVLVLPHEYVLKEKEKFFVFTPDDEKKEIKVGSQNEYEFEVLEGLAEGDKVKQIDFMELLNKT